MIPEVVLRPIGLVRTPFPDRLSAPRQASVAGDVEGTIEIFPASGMEHALEDLEGWERIWIVFLFHLNAESGFRPKVMPPRSTKRRGVLSTRSPYRPNPIGLSAVRLLEVRGLTLRIGGVDMIDGSPVLDVKPYVPYADAFPGARTGWLAPLVGEPAATAEVARDPEAGFSVSFGERASKELAWLKRERGVDLEPEIVRLLALGPQPHAYRRIRAEGAGFRLALRDWRVMFRVEGREVTVDGLQTGYRPSQLAAPASAAEELQREFTDRFSGATNESDG